MGDRLESETNGTMLSVSKHMMMWLKRKDPLGGVACVLRILSIECTCKNLRFHFCASRSVILRDIMKASGVTEYCLRNTVTFA